MCIRARYPSRVVVTLLAASHPAPRRQHDLAWRHFPVLPCCLGTFRAQTMCAQTLQSQDWTTLQQSDLATPHTWRGTLGKTHTSYMTTWRSVGVRRGNVAYCLAFSAPTHHKYMHTYVLVSSRAPWH